MFTCSDYGNFSIWHPESELYLLNMETNEIRNMEGLTATMSKVFTLGLQPENGSSSAVNGRTDYGHILTSLNSTDKKVQPANLSFYPKRPDFYFYFTQTFNLPELLTTPVKSERTDQANSK